MKLIILPGNSKSNKKWSEQTALFFTESYPEQYIQTYSHWEGDGGIIDLETEADKLAENVHSPECIMVAKSAGAMLAAYAMTAKKISPVKCIFLGLPVLWAEEHGFDLKKWLTKIDVPVLIVQNSQDPITPYSEVERLITELQLGNNIQLVETEGENHDYLDLNNIKIDIEKFLS